MKILLSVALICLASVGHATPKQSRVTVLDQRNPDYQLSVEYLSRASQLLQKAQEATRESSRIHALPNLDYDALQAAIKDVETEVNKIIYPEERRLQYQRFVPDSDFFITPTK